jgi:diadenylate cyclase
MDVLDIIVVSFLVYFILSKILGTRAFSMLLGLLLIWIAAYVSSWFNMTALNWVMDKVAAGWVIAFIIVFQPELRNIMTEIGSNPVFRKFTTYDHEYVNKILLALRKLKMEKTGALIVIQRDVGLDSVVGTGNVLDAQLTPELLLTIFSHHSPLHDGAVILNNDRILAAACQLPLTDNQEYDDMYGMRHRAAIGITEGTDAIALVVSEETGAVSMALRGYLRKDLIFPMLRKTLEIILTTKDRIAVSKRA